LAIFKFFIIKN